MAKFVSFRNKRSEYSYTVNVDLVAYVEQGPGSTGCVIVFSSGAKVPVEASRQDVMTELAGRGPTGGVW